MNRSTSQQTLQRIPKKWAVAIVVALIVYALVQPFANSRFGWRLPSLAGALGMEQPAANKPVEPNARVGSYSQATNQIEEKSSQKSNPSDSLDREFERGQVQHGQAQRGQSDLEPEINLTESPTKPTETQTTTKKPPSEKQATEKTPATVGSAPKAAEPKQTKPNDSGDLLYGLLKDTGREVYVSPAGLRYTRGSEEGHRLKHLEKHLKDIPDRPGKHGVFDGDMAQVLRWIDDAFTRGKQGAKGVRKRDEDGRTIYEVPFTKTIGFIGGRDGKRDNNPDAKRLRLVVDGDQVITAFPF